MGEAASVVIQTAFLGDVVLTTPLIALLARRGPVDVVVRPDAAALLANNPDVRALVVYDKRGADRGARGLHRLARRLRAGAPRVAYLAQGSVRSALLARWAGCGERVGFDTSRAARPLYTRVAAYRPDRHHAERLWRLGAADESEPSADDIRPRLYPGDSERQAVDALLAAVGDDGSRRPIVALAPGSVWETKRWPYYAELASRLERSAHIVVVGGPGDGALAEAITAACPTGRVTNAAGRLSLLASAELVRRAALLVTNDSAPQHLASAMGTPTVTLFGPTVPDFGFGPLAHGSQSVGHPALACRPCDRHGPRACPLRHWRCMRELAPDAVAELATRVMRG